MREVIPKVLWIGNAKEARDVKAVLGLGITAVVDLAMEETPILFPRDVAYCRFPLVDGAGNTPALIEAAIATTVSFIRGKVPALVACDGGMSRSPAIVAAALAAIEETSPEQALERVAAAGPHDISTTFWKEVRQASNREKWMT
jgi:protein-tyrosine phosphatase